MKSPIVKAITQKIVPYEYPSAETYCDYGTVEYLIIQQIKEFHREFDNKDVTDERADLDHLSLIQVINHYVEDRHRSTATPKEAKDHPERKVKNLSFTELARNIRSNPWLLGEDIDVLKMRSQFQKIGHAFVDEQPLEDMPEQDANEFRSILKTLDTLSSEQFETFCKLINPHEPSVSDNINLVQKNALLDSFFPAIFQNLEHVSIGNPRISIRWKKLVFMPTTIARKATAARHVARSILLNERNVEDLFEIDVLVSSQIDLDSLEGAAGSANYYSIDDDPDLAEEYGKDRRRYTHIRSLRIMSVDNVTLFLKKNGAQ